MTETKSPSSPIDPLLLSSEWGSSLFLGISGTGKTTLMVAGLRQHLVKKNVKPSRLFCINARGNEYDSLGGNTASLEKIASLPKKSFLVVEDIIDIGNKNEVLLRRTLNVNLHHKNQKLFAAAHSNVKTKLWSNIQYFDYIIFPGEKSNHVNFRSIIAHFRLGKNSTETFSQAFLDECGKKPKRYVILDVKNISIYSGASLEAMTSEKDDCYKLIGSLENENADNSTTATTTTSQIQQQFEQLIEGYKYKKRALAIFSLLEKCIFRHFKITDDLLIVVGKNQIKLSLVDYIHFLVDPESGRPPWKYISFHGYVSEKCHIPQLAIQNPSFLTKKS
jgi:hypothetical protein